MTILEQLQSEHKARHDRLFAPIPIKRKTKAKIIPIVGGKQFYLKPSVAVPDIVWALPTLPVSARTASIKTIKKAVAAGYGVTELDLMSDSRVARVAWPRQVAMYLLRRQNLHFPVIARLIGNRHHTTVLHACRKVAALRASDPNVDIALSAIEAALA